MGSPNGRASDQPEKAHHHNEPPHRRVRSHRRDLDREIRIEEDRVKIHNPAHSAYSTYAKATALRRDNLRLLSTGSEGGRPPSVRSV